MKKQTSRKKSGNTTRKHHNKRTTLHSRKIKGGVLDTSLYSNQNIFTPTEQTELNDISGIYVNLSNRIINSGYSLNTRPIVKNKIRNYIQKLNNSSEISEVLDNLLKIFKDLVSIGEDLDTIEILNAETSTTAPGVSRNKLQQNEIDNIRLKLKKNILFIIKKIRELNYQYVPGWIDSLEYNVENEFLRKLIRGDFISIINTLFKKSTPKSKSKGIRVKMNMYNSYLNKHDMQSRIPTESNKKKMVLSVEPYGMNSTEDAEEMIQGLFIKGKNLTEPTKKNDAPITSSSHNIDMTNIQ